MTARSGLAARVRRSAVCAAPAATMVYCRRSRRTCDDAVPRLLVRSGPGAGTVVALSADETRLGRGHANDVVLPDISVSRRHALLRREGGGYLLRDEGSGNGTRVNGRPVEQARLRTGDRIALGDAVVEFLAAADVAVRGRAERAPMQRSWTPRAAGWTAIAAIPLAAAVVTIGSAAFRSGPRIGDERRTVQMQSQPSRRPVEVLAPVDEVPSEPASVVTPAAWRVEKEPGAPLAAALPAIGAPPARPRKRAATEAPTGILEAYLSGDLDVAIARARAAGGEGNARDVLASLQRVEAARREGLAFMERDRTGEAIRVLEEAEGEDRALAQSRDGPLGREIRRALSVLHTRAAASVDAEAEVGAAAAHLRSAVALDAQNERAREQLRAIAARAVDTYLRGYVAKDGDPAAARDAFRWVVAALPAADETAVKARRWLDRLDGKAPTED